MKIVVAGALGHIGSRLIRDLPGLIGGCEILMIDNLLTQRFASLFNLPSEYSYRFVEGDVRDLDLPLLFQGADLVVQLAAITDATGSFENREAVERNNYFSTKRVAEACVAAGAPMIHVSSTSVYGTQKERVDEFCDAKDLVPQSPYAETKLREESLVGGMVKEGRLRAVIFRFGTIFGVSPGMRFHTAVNKFCWQAVMGQPLTVWRTTYDQVRPYLDLEDALRAVAFVIQRRLFDGNVYNVVTRNCTVRQIVETIRAEVSDLKLDFVDSRIMNQLSYEVANSRLSAQGFEFVGDPEMAIRETIELMRSANSRTMGRGV